MTGLGRDMDGNWEFSIGVDGFTNASELRGIVGVDPPHRDGVGAGLQVYQYDACMITSEKLTLTWKSLSPVT